MVKFPSNLLRQLRTEDLMTQELLAEKADLSINTIRNAEAGCSVSLTTAQRIIDVLDDPHRKLIITEGEVILELADSKKATEEAVELVMLQYNRNTEAGVPIQIIRELMKILETTAVELLHCWEGSLHFTARIRDKRARNVLNKLFDRNQNGELIVPDLRDSEIRRETQEYADKIRKELPSGGNVSILGHLDVGIGKSNICKLYEDVRIPELPNCVHTTKYSPEEAAPCRQIASGYILQSHIAIADRDLEKMNLLWNTIPTEPVEGRVRDPNAQAEEETIWLYVLQIQKLKLSSIGMSIDKTGENQNEPSIILANQRWLRWVGRIVQSRINDATFLEELVENYRTGSRTKYAEVTTSMCRKNAIFEGIDPNQILESLDTWCKIFEIAIEKGVSIKLAPLSNRRK